MVSVRYNMWRSKAIVFQDLCEGLRYLEPVVHDMVSGICSSRYPSRRRRHAVQSRAQLVDFPAT